MQSDGRAAMASSIHSLIPRLAIVVVPVALVVGAYAAYRQLVHAYDVPDGSDIFQVVEGRWALPGPAGNCDTNAVTIRFTADHADMILISPHPMRRDGGELDSMARFPLLGHTRHSIRVVRRGETRLGADGTPVVWDLVLRSPDTYSWHRSDWLPIAFTREHQRCPALKG
jgi:hypothetical protein